MTARVVLRRAAARTVCASLVLGLASVSWACGVCDEDSVAATYDHAVVQRAARAHDLVVYCSLEGPVEQQKVSSVLRRVPGVRKDSIRVSAAPAALSFAVNPAVQTALTAVAATEKGLGSSGHLRILKVVPSAPGRRVP
jgi:hypothetical protein